MTAWLTILTVAVVAQNVALVRHLRRASSPTPLSMTPGETASPTGNAPGSGVVIGRPLRLSEFGVAARPVTAGSVIVMASVRSVSAHHIVAIVARLVGREQSPVRWRWFVAGPTEEVKSFGGECLRCEAVDDQVIVGAGAAGHPVAAYIDEAGFVAHAGSIWNMASLLTFVEACPNAQLRQWLARSAAGDPEMTRHGDVGRRAPVSPLNVLDHWDSAS